MGQEITDPALNDVVYACTLADRTFWVDEASGDDNDNDGLSFASPFASLTPFEPLLQRGLKHITRVMVGPGNYVMPSIPAKGIDGGGALTIEADEARAGVFNELVASQVSDAGTTATLVKFIGNVADFGGAIIEVLDGGDAGERRHIQHNTLDPEDLAMQRPLANIAPGDSFRIFRSNVVIAPPDPDGADTGESFGWFGGDLLPTAGGTASPKPGVIALLFVSLDNSATFSNHTFGPAFYYLYGVEMLNSGDRFIWHGDAIVQAGYTGQRVPLEDIIPGLDPAKWQGCGIANQDLNGPFMDSPNGRVEGYVRCGGRLNPGEGTSFFLGGYTTLAQPSQDGGLLDLFPVPGVGSWFLDAGGLDTPAAKCIRAGKMRLRFLVNMRKGTGSANLMESLEGGDILINAFVTGEHPDLPGAVRTVFVDSDSRVFCEFGTPALGSATEDDWEVVGAPVFNKSDLSAAGIKVFADGSIAARVS